MSPLKVYEYLACGLPVAAPPLRPLLDLSGVFVNDDLVEAVREALTAPKPDRYTAIADHSWGSRLVTMMGAVDEDLREVEGPGVTVVIRPPIHYDKNERWIRSD